MREPHCQKVDLVSVLKATDYGQARLDYYRQVVADVERDQRLQDAQCVFCWNNGRVGGSLCSQAKCGLCETVMNFNNTCVDVLCKRCALDRRLCRRCGADVNLKNRRKL